MRHHRLSALATLCLAACASQAPAPTAPTAAPPAPPPAATAVAVSVAPPPPPPVPFALQAMALANGVAGRNISFASANPVNYEDIIAGKPLPAVTLQAKLYMPAGGGTAKRPAVIITPGSGGVAPPMLLHARALVDAGIAVLLVDPFGGRGVVNTIAAQDPFSFAASSYDIFAAMRALEREPGIDRERLGAMGYSRGGIAVLQAAVAPLAKAVLGPTAKPLRAVLGGWPWCGYQFAEPATAPTAVRLVSGDVDDYVSTPQCQGYASAMKARNPAVSMRVVRDGRHGFGYGAPLRELPTAIKALNAPAIYFDNRGVMQDIWSGQALPGADDRAVLRMAAPFVSRGAKVGAQPGQLDDFVADLVGYFSAQLK